MTEFEACFAFACPKFLSPVPPNYDMMSGNGTQHKVRSGCHKVADSLIKSAKGWGVQSKARGKEKKKRRKKERKKERERKKETSVVALTNKQ